MIKNLMFLLFAGLVPFTSQAALLTPSGEPYAAPVVPEKGPRILIFWATWCPPCQEELADVQEKIKKGNIPANAVLAISYESPKSVADTVKKRGYTFPVVIDLEQEYFRQFKIEEFPTAFLVVDQKVRVVEKDLFSKENLKLFVEPSGDDLSKSQAPETDHFFSP